MAEAGLCRQFLSSIQVLIYFIILCLFLPIVFLFVLLPLTLTRQFVNLCSKLFGPKKLGNMIGKLCGLHAVDKVYEEPMGNLLITLHLERKLDIDTYITAFIERVLEKKDAKGKLLYPELRSYITTFMGYSFWERDENFDARNHYIIHESENDEQVTESKLLEIRSKLIKEPWQANRPVWKAVIIDNFCGGLNSNSEGTVVLFLAHHCLMDGYSVINVLVGDMANASLDQVIAKPSLPTYKQIQLKRMQENKAQGTVSTFISKLSFPTRALYEYSKELTRGADYNDWRKPNMKLTKVGKFTFANSISVDHIKEIKNGHGVSFTSVLLAAVCAGMRRSMEENGARIPKFIDCFTVFPMPKHPKKLTNHLTYTLLRLPTGNPDSRARLLEIESNLQKLKNSTIPYLNFWLAELIGDLPRFILKNLSNQNFPSTVAMSNFPAPNQRLTFFGSKVNRVEFEAGPMLGLAFGYGCLTYNGTATIFAGVDSCVPGYSKISTSLIQFFEEELDILYHYSLP